MGIYNRTGVLWIAYAVPKDVAERFGCARLQRESAKTGDKRVAGRLLAQRRRELREGTWVPPSSGAGQTLSDYAVVWTAKRKLDGLRSAERDADMLKPLLVTLGDKRVAEIKRSDVREAVAAFRRMTSARGKVYSPMTVHRAYGVLRALFNDALCDEVVQINPCSLRAKSDELPARKDADPRWRAQAIFTRDEIEQLISDERILEVRRVLYALTFFGGLRLGEAVARTWGDYDPAARPLGRLSVATQHEGRELKTDRPREVPVHPVLAKILARWKLERYELHYGAAAKPGDLIVRNKRGERFLPNSTWENLLFDLRTLGLRRRRYHDLRRTLITLARADGARPDLLRWVTHGASGDIMDVYTTPVWESLCEQISCLRVELREGNVVSIRKNA